MENGMTFLHGPRLLGRLLLSFASVGMTQADRPPIRFTFT